MSVRTPREESKRPPVWPYDTVPAFHHPDSARYLRDRAVTKQQAEEHALAYCERGPWAKRILIPFLSDTGGLLGFQGRIITPNYTGGDKYKTEGIRPLYCPWTEPREPWLMIVEGPFDYFKMNQVVPAAATLGYHPSERQFLDILDIVMKYNLTKIGIWYDPDPDALGEAHALALKIRPYVKDVSVIETPEGSQDPGGLDKDTILRILAQERWGDFKEDDEEEETNDSEGQDDHDPQPPNSGGSGEGQAGGTTSETWWTDWSPGTAQWSRSGWEQAQRHRPNPPDHPPTSH